MYYSILILAISLINLVMVSALLYGFMKNSKALRDFSGERYRHLDAYFNDMLERIQRIEGDHPVQALAKFDSPDRKVTNPVPNRIKSAIEKIREGADPEEIRREHGYSGSEMGIIMATAGLDTPASTNK